jgi:hypothetical protein
MRIGLRLLGFAVILQLVTCSKALTNAVTLIANNASSTIVDINDAWNGNKQWVSINQNSVASITLDALVKTGSNDCLVYWRIRKNNSDSIFYDSRSSHEGATISISVTDSMWNDSSKIVKN